VRRGHGHDGHLGRPATDGANGDDRRPAHHRHDRRQDDLDRDHDKHERLDGRLGLGIVGCKLGHALRVRWDRRRIL
jgi:hypothetical protein